MAASAPRGERVGIFGGSFDPPHVGHLILADTCREALRLDRVEFIPTATSPLKRNGPLAANEHRVEMVRQAIAGNPGFQLNRLEIERGGISYTVDTVEHLSQLFPEVEWYLIVGADSVLTMNKWHRPADLLKQVHLAIVMRGGVPEPDFQATRELLNPEDRHRFEPWIVPMPLLQLSSTELRERVAAGKSIRYRVPPSVENYIEQHGLYGGS